MFVGSVVCLLDCWLARLFACWHAGVLAGLVLGWLCWFVGCLAGSLACLLVLMTDWFAGLFVGLMTDWFAGWLDYWFACCRAGWLAGWVATLLADLSRKTENVKPKTAHDRKPEDFDVRHPFWISFTSSIIKKTGTKQTHLFAYFLDCFLHCFSICGWTLGRLSLAGVWGSSLGFSRDKPRWPGRQRPADVAIAKCKENVKKFVCLSWAERDITRKTYFIMTREFA